MATQKKLAPTEVLIREGDVSGSMYWVQSGQLAVTKRRGNEQVVLGHIATGELVGEISFLDQDVRSATVTATTDCELIEIPRETFDNLFSSQPKWLGILVRTLAERLRKANARIKV